MKVLLLKDVYKLGRAGDVKRVADGFGRNFLIPQGLAVLATPGALSQSEKIRQKAETQRAILNQEMGLVAEKLNNVELFFAARAGETGKLYGSITTQDVNDELEKKLALGLKRQQIDMQPLRSLGEHTVRIRLTMDMIPEIKVTVYREGEAEPGRSVKPETATPVEEEVSETSEVPAPTETETITDTPVEE